MRNRIRVKNLVEFRMPMKDLKRMKKIKKKLEEDFYEEHKDSIDKLLREHQKIKG